MSEDRPQVKISCRNCHSHFDVSELEPFSVIPCPECGTKLRIPKPFGRYQLEKSFGSNPSAQVYRAIDPLLARRVVVKIIPDASRTPEIRERFLQGAKLAAALTHPGLVPVYDCGVIGGDCFLVMQYLEKGDLARLASSTPPPAPEQSLQYLAGVADGLELISRNQLVHGGVSLANVLVSGDDEAKLGHFDALGPETAGNNPDVADFGAALFELFCGRSPRPGGEALIPRSDCHFSRDFCRLEESMFSAEADRRPTFARIAAALRAEAEQIKENEGRWSDRLSRWLNKKKAGGEGAAS